MPHESAKPLRLKDRVRVSIRRTQLRRVPTWVLFLAVAVLLLFSLLYQRCDVLRDGGSVSSSERGQARLTFLGSVYPGGEYRGFFDGKGTVRPLTGVSALWVDSDYVFAGLDCPVLPRDPSRYSPLDVSEPRFCTPAQFIALSDAGVNAFAIANDHSGDYKKKGLTEMVDWLDGNSVLYAGYLPYRMATSLDDESNGAQSNNFTRLNCGGYRVGFLSIADYYFREEPLYGVLTTARNELLEYVVDAAIHNDFVVVYVHWKDSGSPEVTERQRELAQDLINAGANVVIGTGPAVLQPVELYGRGIVCYSLGSLTPDSESSFSRDTVLIQFDLDGDGNKTLSLYPAHVQNGIPRLATHGFHNRRILNRLLCLLDADSFTVNNGVATIPLK